MSHHCQTYLYVPSLLVLQQNDAQHKHEVLGQVVGQVGESSENRVVISKEHHLHHSRTIGEALLKFRRNES